MLQDRGSRRDIGIGPEMLRYGPQIHVVKPAGASRRWSGHSDNQVHDDEERPGKGHRQTKRARHQPDAEANRNPQRQRPRHQDNHRLGVAHDGEPFGELSGKRADASSHAGWQPLSEPISPLPHALGMAGEHKQGREPDDRSGSGDDAGCADKKWLLAIA